MSLSVQMTLGSAIQAFEEEVQSSKESDVYLIFLREAAELLEKSTGSLKAIAEYFQINYPLWTTPGKKLRKAWRVLLSCAVIEQGIRVKEMPTEKDSFKVWKNWLQQYVG